MRNEVEQYMAILKQNYEAQEEYIQQLRSIKHDIDAHMIVLQYYMEEGAYDRAKAYLKQMQTHQEKLNRVYVETGNRMLNAVLSERLKQSVVDMEVNCYGELGKTCVCAEYDLCIIFSNLFANAVEACEKLKCKKRQIDIEIQENPMQEEWRILFCNPIEENIDMALLKGGTSKEDKDMHGHGLRNVREAVERNGGKMQLRADAENFIVEIGLPSIRESCLQKV